MKRTNHYHLKVPFRDLMRNSQCGRNDNMMKQSAQFPYSLTWPEVSWRLRWYWRALTFRIGQTDLVMAKQQLILEFCNKKFKREIAPIANTTLPPYRLHWDSVCQRSKGKRYSPAFTVAIHGLTPPLFAMCSPLVLEPGRHTRPLKWRHGESRVTYRLPHRHHGRCVKLK